MSATTTHLLFSGEFCILCYGTIPVKSASADVSLYTNNSKMTNFELWHSCRKWVIWFPMSLCPTHSYVAMCMCMTHNFLKKWEFWDHSFRGQLKCDGTRAETRFRLSSERTSPFQSTGGISSVDYWQPRCAHQP